MHLDEGQSWAGGGGLAKLAVASSELAALSSPKEAVSSPKAAAGQSQKLQDPSCHPPVGWD